LGGGLPPETRASTELFFKNLNNVVPQDILILLDIVVFIAHIWGVPKGGPYVRKSQKIWSL